MKNELIFKCYFLRRALGTANAPFTRMFVFGTHQSAESTEGMQIKCIAQGHINIFEPSTSVSIKQNPVHATNILDIFIWTTTDVWLLVSCSVPIGTVWAMDTHWLYVLLH